MKQTSIFESAVTNYNFDPLSADWKASLLECSLQVTVILRSEVKISGFAYFNDLIWIPVEIFWTEWVGAKIQRPGKWRSHVTWISPEDHVDDHRRDGLVIVVDDRNRKPSEPVIIVVECFTDFDVRFFRGFSGDDFHWFYAPRLSSYGALSLR